MTDTDKGRESPATILCKSCGLCCSGHLFAWVKLRSPELVPLESLGVNVSREPRHRGFSQACPLWDGQCTIYDSPDYPRACHTYKCKLLKKVIDGSTVPAEAMTIVQRAKEMIQELESFLPVSSNNNFRERLVEQIELENKDLEFQRKAKALLNFYKDYFGVKDLVNSSEEV
jgi:hypothetical protein